MKENNIPIAVKIIKITKERFTIKHWRIEGISNSLQPTLSKCERCIYSSKNSTECIISKSLGKWHQVMIGVTRKGENLAKSKLPTSAYIENFSHGSVEFTDQGERAQIEILSKEEAIIQKVIKKEDIQAELKAIAEKLKGKRKLDIYTDSSLAKEGIGDSSKKIIRLGWVVARKIIIV